MRKKIIVFGTGQLGSDLARQPPPWVDILTVPHATCDITDYEMVKELLLREHPTLVINAAAYNKVEDAEEHPSVAFRVNADGPGNIASVTNDLGIPVLHVSTDYVFDGANNKGFVEDDPICPVNAYGRSKAAGEQKVTSANERHWIIRTSALFGMHVGEGKRYNFVTRMLEYGKRDGRVRVVSDQWTVPTSSRDLAEGIWRMIEQGIPYGVYHLVAEGAPTTWADYARKIFEISGISATVEDISTFASGTRIQRPRFSVLRNTKLKKLGIQLPIWEDGLARYLQMLNAL